METTSIKATSLKPGDVIVEHPAGQRKANVYTVKSRRTDNVGCRHVHVDISGGGTWCYHSDALVNVRA